MNGVLAARGAGQGLLGAAGILERNGGRIAGVDISEARLLGELGERYLFDDVGMKPYPVARQALAAIEAARELVDAEKIESGSISEILVGVPAAQLRVIDHPEMPGSRMDSIISVQYQIALALCMPDLMTKVRVQRAPDLEEYYPEAWPGRVEIATARRRWSRTVIYPLGDARNPFDSEATTQKFRRLAAPQLGVSAAEDLIGKVREEVPPALWASTLPFYQSS
jgi:2-methylcitrate dehydratase PrpD